MCGIFQKPCESGLFCGLKVLLIHFAQLERQAERDGGDQDQQAFGGDFGVAAVYSSLLILITAITLGLALKLGKMDEQNF